MNDDKPLKKEDEIEKLNKENDLLQQNILELEQKLQAFEPVQKLYNKRRRDMLYSLNVKNVGPREDTLNKYSIKFDQEKNLYI